MARQVATSSFGAQARAGVKPLESAAETVHPLDKRVSVTSTMPLGAQIWSGLVFTGQGEKKILKTNKQKKINRK